MQVKREIAVIVALCTLTGCVSETTQKALTAAQQQCAADMARGWSVYAPSCQQAGMLQNQADLERQQSTDLAVGLGAAVLAAGAVAAASSPGPAPRGPGPRGPAPGPRPGPSGPPPR